MRKALQEKTNTTTDTEVKQSKVFTDKERVATFLKSMAEETKDYSLRYDILKCIETIEGKENRDISELKDMLTEILEENERLTEERCELIMTIESLKNNRM